VPRYLADTSIWAWAHRPDRPDIAEKLEARLEDGAVATCVPVALELMHRADPGRRYAEMFEELLEPLDWLPATETASLRALEVQQALARRSDGAHRRSPVDLLTAAVAEQRDDVVLWAFDRDYRVIADVTGQPTELESASE
jgi:predicted nucleic acid-binding protein